MKPNTPCQACGFETDLREKRGPGWASGAVPGDLNVCLNCGALGIFTAEMVLRPPRPEECGNLPEAAITFQFAIRQRGLLAEAAAAKILRRE